MKQKLIELQTAIASGASIAEVGSIYKQLESLSVGVEPASASKPYLMQTMRKHLMQNFGAEMMRVGSMISDAQLAQYDAVAELNELINLLD